MIHAPIGGHLLFSAVQRCIGHPSVIRSFRDALDACCVRARAGDPAGATARSVSKQSGLVGRRRRDPCCSIRAAAVCLWRYLACAEVRVRTVRRMAFAAPATETRAVVTRRLRGRTSQPAGRDRIAQLGRCPKVQVCVTQTRKPGIVWFEARVLFEEPKGHDERKERMRD